MGGGYWDAIMGYAANTGEPWEPSRAQMAGSAATVRDVSRSALVYRAGLWQLRQQPCR
jgi:hypothetical protein